MRIGKKAGKKQEGMYGDKRQDHLPMTFLSEETVGLSTMIMTAGILLVNIIFYAKKWKAGTKG